MGGSRIYTNIQIHTHTHTPLCGIRERDCEEKKEQTTNKFKHIMMAQARSSRLSVRGTSSRRRTRASMRFSRLRTAHDCTIRDIVASSWDDPAATRSEHAAASFRHASGVSAPILAHVPLGKSWSADVVAVVHNAVRCEIADLFDILASMLLSSEVSNVTVAELRAFFAWFSTFEAFVVTCLKAEEEVLYPWLEQWGRIDGSLSTASRINTKGAIIRGIRDTATCAALVGLHHNLPAGVVLTNPDRHYYDALKVGFAEVGPATAAQHSAILCTDVLQKVVAHVSEFTTAIIAYFEDEERSLPSIIESLYDAEDVRAAAVERRTIRAIWKCGRKDESMVMLVRPIDDRAVAKAWIQRNFKRLERVSLPLWRRRYQSGRGAVVARFRQRKTRHEQIIALHAHQQRQRNAIANNSNAHLHNAYNNHPRVTTNTHYHHYPPPHLVQEQSEMQTLPPPTFIQPPTQMRRTRSDRNAATIRLRSSRPFYYP